MTYRLTGVTAVRDSKKRMNRDIRQEVKLSQVASGEIALSEGRSKIPA
jgi:hypothetical protein